MVSPGTLRDVEVPAFLSTLGIQPVCSFLDGWPKSLAVLKGPYSVPLTSTQFHPPGQQAGLLSRLMEGTCVPSTAPAQGPLGRRRPTPELHACPMLSVHVCSPPPRPLGACTTLPAAPLLPPHSLETCPFCFFILPSLLFIVVVVVSWLWRRRGLKGLEGPGPHSQHLCSSRALGRLPSGPMWPERSLPPPSSAQPP